MRQPVAQPDTLEQHLRPIAVGAAIGEGHADHYVFQRGKGRQQVECLEHVADFCRPELIPIRFGEDGDIPAVDEDAARIGPADSGDHMQQRGFATSALADNHDLLAGLGVEVLDVEHVERRAVGQSEGLGYLPEF